jgi:hypothetical protein
MPESVSLTTPFVADPRQASAFTVDALLLNWKERRIEVHLGGNGIQKKVEYVDLPDDPIATTLMVALNKMNLSTQSLHKRILLRLIADGHLSGTITGTPD